MKSSQISSLSGTLSDIVGHPIDTYFLIVTQVDSTLTLSILKHTSCSSNPYDEIYLLYLTLPLWPG